MEKVIENNGQGVIKAILFGKRIQYMMMKVMSIVSGMAYLIWVKKVSVIN